MAESVPSTISLLNLIVFFCVCECVSAPFRRDKGWCGSWSQVHYKDITSTCHWHLPGPALLGWCRQSGYDLTGRITQHLGVGWAHTPLFQ